MNRNNTRWEKITGWERLIAQLNYLVGDANSNSEYSNVVGHIKTLEVESLENMCTQLFTRGGNQEDIS